MTGYQAIAIFDIFILRTIQKVRAEYRAKSIKGIRPELASGNVFYQRQGITNKIEEINPKAVTMTVNKQEINSMVEEIDSKSLEINYGTVTITVETEAMSVTDKEINYEAVTMSVKMLEIDSMIKALIHTKS